MAKKKGKKKSENQLLLEAEYKRVRRNTRQNIRRLAARGYDVSAIQMPKIPEKITPGSIRRLQELNEKRYKLSTHWKIDFVDNPDTGKTEIVQTKVQGTKYRYTEKKKASEKRKSTAMSNKLDREHKQYLRELNERADKAWNEGREDEYYETRDTIKYIEYADSHEGFYEFARNLSKAGVEYTNEDIIKAYEMTYEPSVDHTNGEYSMDPVSGEVRETDSLSSYDWRGKTWTVLSSQDTAENIVNKALEDLDVMIQYSGTSDTGKRIHGFNKVITTQNNAQMIKDYIVEHLKTEPDRVVAVLRNMMDEEGFHTVDYMYSSGGYQRFLKYYNSAFVFQDIEDED